MILIKLYHCDGNREIGYRLIVSKGFDLNVEKDIIEVYLPDCTTINIPFRRYEINWNDSTGRSTVQVYVTKEYYEGDCK